MPAAVAVKPADPKIKGIALEGFLDWYARNEGAGRLRAVLEALPESQRSAFTLDDRNFGILASGWYDASLVHAIIEGVIAGLDESARSKLAVRGAEAIVRSNLRGIYKVLFRLFMTPERYAQRAQALWDRYYDAGIVEKKVESATRHTASIRDWTSHHPILCEMNAEAGRIIYEELGCKNVRSHRTQCVAQGHAVCSQVVTWDP